jgi:hypothetical protein
MYQLAAHCEPDPDNEGQTAVYWITYNPEYTSLGVGWEIFDDLDAIKARWPDAGRYVCLD